MRSVSIEGVVARSDECLQGSCEALLLGVLCFKVFLLMCEWVTCDLEISSERMQCVAHCRLHVMTEKFSIFPALHTCLRSSFFGLHREARNNFQVFSMAIRMNNNVLICLHCVYD